MIHSKRLSKVDAWPLRNLAFTRRGASTTDSLSFLSCYDRLAAIHSSCIDTVHVFAVFLNPLTRPMLNIGLTIGQESSDTHTTYKLGGFRLGPYYRHGVH